MIRYTILDNDLQRKLNSIGRDLPNALRGIVEESNYRLTMSAKMRAAPLRTGSGNLREAIKGEVRQSRSGNWMAVVSVDESKTTRNFGKGAPFNYALAQEEGFTPHAIHWTQWMGPKVPADRNFMFVKRSTPFMRPALEEYAERGIDNVINQYIDRVIR